MSLHSFRSCIFFFKQKTAYEMRISDWSSDVCSSDLIDTVTGEKSHVTADGAFVAIGHKPATELFEGVLPLDEGSVVVENGTTRQGIPGVFAAGAVSDQIYRQAVTAAGIGCMAAFAADRFLASAEDRKTVAQGPRV